MEPSRCGQGGKGIQVFAFRVIPGTEREEDVNGYADLPVHLPMIATVTKPTNHEKFSLIESNCTGSPATVFKGQLRSVCKKASS